MQTIFHSSQNYLQTASTYASLSDVDVSLEGHNFRHNSSSTCINSRPPLMTWLDSGGQRSRPSLWRRRLECQSRWVFF